MRSKRAPKRVINPDPKYGSIALAKFVNAIMRRGKKTVAQSVVYGAFDRVETLAKQKALDVFDKAVKNVAPHVEVRPRRIGGANYQVPVEVRGERRTALAYRWIIAAAQAKKGKPMADKLAEELLLAAKGEGDAVKKRYDMHRMAEANRAFAHFA